MQTFAGVVTVVLSGVCIVAFERVGDVWVWRWAGSEYKTQVLSTLVPASPFHTYTRTHKHTIYSHKGVCNFPPQS